MISKAQIDVSRRKGKEWRGPDVAPVAGLSLAIGQAARTSNRTWSCISKSRLTEKEPKLGCRKAH